MIRFSLLLSSGMLFGSLVGQCLAQDAHVRQQAQTLLERANSLSVPRQFRSYEQTIIFQSSSPTGVREGRFTSVVQGPYLYRDEYEFGDYRLLVVGNEDMVAEVGDRSRAPTEIRRMTRLSQPYSARFDQTDVIRSIREGEVNGRPAQCIDFDTITGEKTEANEVCIDRQLGVVARVHANGETITHANFFPYRDTFIPAHITYEQGDLRMELEQSKTETNGPFDPNLLLPPAGAKVGQVCNTFRRAFGKFMPQPKAGSGSQNVDVIVHGTVRTDGTVRDPSIDVCYAASQVRAVHQTSFGIPMPFLGTCSFPDVTHFQPSIPIPQHPE